jgi:hypothetical protein
MAPLWHDLCMTTLDDDSKGKSPFQHPVNLPLTLLTLVSSIIALLSLSRVNRMAMDIVSLAAWLDEYVFRLGIERWGLWNTLGNPDNLFLGALPFQCRLSSHCTTKRYYSFAYSPLPTNIDSFVTTAGLRHYRPSLPYFILLVMALG